MCEVLYYRCTTCHKDILPTEKEVNTDNFHSVCGSKLIGVVKNGCDDCEQLQQRLDRIAKACKRDHLGYEDLLDSIQEIQSIAKGEE